MSSGRSVLVIDLEIVLPPRDQRDKLTDAGGGLIPTLDRSSRAKHSGGHLMFRVLIRAQPEEGLIGPSQLKPMLARLSRDEKTID
jgi:hypothetical protein